MGRHGAGALKVTCQILRCGLRGCGDEFLDACVWCRVEGGEDEGWSEENSRVVDRAWGSGRGEWSGCVGGLAIRSGRGVWWSVPFLSGVAMGLASSWRRARGRGGTGRRRAARGVLVAVVAARGSMARAMGARRASGCLGALEDRGMWMVGVRMRRRGGLWRGGRLSERKGFVSVQSSCRWRVIGIARVRRSVNFFSDVAVVGED